MNTLRSFLMRDHRCQLSLFSLSVYAYLSAIFTCNSLFALWNFKATCWGLFALYFSSIESLWPCGSNFPFTSVDISKVVTILNWHPNQHKKMKISLSHENSDSLHIDLLMWLRGRALGTAQQMEDGSSRSPAGPQKHRRKGHGAVEEGIQGI